MKKIYVQKFLFYFMIIMGSIFSLFSIIGGLLIEKALFIILIIGGFFIGLSFLFKINKIIIYEDKIKFHLAMLKREINYVDIKQVVVYGTNKPMFLIINLSEKLNINVTYAEYIKESKTNGNDCIYLMLQGMMKKDCDDLISIFYEKELIN